MVVTDLSVNVVNVNVDRVSMSSDLINLQLYSQDDYIYLKDHTAEENNLNVSMKADGIEIDVRLDEIDFNLLSDEERFHGYPKFVRKNNIVGGLNEIDLEDYVILSNNSNKLIIQNKLTNETLECTINSKISVGDYDIINNLTISGVEYLCENGIAFVNDKSIKLLNAGSYLDFYVYDYSTNIYTLATETDIKYSFETIGYGANKKWKVVVESYDASKTLVLGLMVANNSGAFNADYMFITKGVQIGENLLSYEKLNATATLNLVAKEGVYDPDVKPFSYFYTIGGGTYTACLMVIKDSDIEDNAVVEYVNAYFKIDEEKYYIVGNYDGAVYTNSVIAKDDDKLTKDSGDSLYLFNLKMHISKQLSLWLQIC